MAQSNEHNGAATPSEASLPAIAAAFLVTFDNRKGYTIIWQRSVNDANLDGVVEFKALPSGLHNVEKDLVYFVHDDLAGISAFLRRDDQEAARNARMLSVGVMMPLEAGKLGKGFLYAPELQELAISLIEDPTDHSLLDAFWEKCNKADNESPEGNQQEQGNNNSEGYQKLRALSTISLGAPGVTRTLPVHHPALSIPEFLQVFGPLLFPLARAALLQKRILILGEAPVEHTCNYVYNLSILSSISRSVTSFIPKFEPGKARLKPLFNVGISDIPLLESTKGAWVACTTDDVLASKPKLFDLLVVLPNSTSGQKGGPRTYPRLIQSSPEMATTFPQHGLRATQRDARRYAAMKNTLHELPSSATLESQLLEDANSETVSIASSVSTVVDNREAIEALPWSVVAYTSFIWWASAGDRRGGLLEAEEIANDQDEQILRDSISEEGTTKEVALIAYFHTLSTLIFEVLISAVRRSDGVEASERYRDEETEEGNADTDVLVSSDSNSEEPVEIIEEDIRAMGLDIWSAMDKQFVVDMVDVWWQRKAIVRGGAIECCGIRLL